MRELSHALAERLPHLDYDRETALAALLDLTACRSGSHVLPRSGPHTHRIRHRGARRLEGTRRRYLLMTRLIEVACEAGIVEVPRENKPMLDIAASSISASRRRRAARR
jgi:hypothetical protein